MTIQTIIEALFMGQYNDPFSFLGAHSTSGRTEFRVLKPEATAVTILDRETGKSVITLNKVDKRGFFHGTVKQLPDNFNYVLAVTWDTHQYIIEDPYRFGTLLTEYDNELLSSGYHRRSYEILGAHIIQLADVRGVRFAIWAPNAQRVAVVGDFNFWDGRQHPMRLRPESGIWEIFIPAVTEGCLYKYAITDVKGQRYLKADPYAFFSQLRPDTASIVSCLPARKKRTPQQNHANQRDQPISIYEVHLGSWRRSKDNGGWLSYHDLAEQLIPYVKSMGFTHIEILPISEHPFDGSWGYQPTSLYSPSSRFGKPEDLCQFIDIAHQHGLNIILDWVPGHFPDDDWGLKALDGTTLYEYADPREGFHQDWHTLIYNYKSRGVRHFLASNALYWLERFGFDALRVDAVASMIYRDYSRTEGAWLPNEYGGNINLEAVDFLRYTNHILHTEQPGICTMAEESTDFPCVTLPPEHAGLGFNYKWNMGWMYDTLRYMQLDPVYRQYHHEKMTFGLLYVWSENFILPLSHDEVVHGKGSLLQKMSGSDEEKFANLRAYYAFMWAYPGKKLLFMGNEFAQWKEWDHDSQLDWYLLDDPHSLHSGMQRLVCDLNQIYKTYPVLSADHCPESFQWRIVDDNQNSVFAFIRCAPNEESVLVISHFSAILHRHYRIGVNVRGLYQFILNSDAKRYSSKEEGENTAILSQSVPAHGCPYSLTITLPPLTTIYITRKEPLTGECDP